MLIFQQILNTFSNSNMLFVLYFSKCPERDVRFYLKSIWFGCYKQHTLKNTMDFLKKSLCPYKFYHSFCFYLV